MSTTLSPLEGALRVGGGVLVHGPGAPVAKIIKLVQEQRGAGEPIDVRDAAQAPAERELRKLVGERVGDRSAVIWLLGSDFPDQARAVISELLDGQLNVAPGDVRKLDPELSVVALSPDAQPADEVRALFTLQLVADAALGPAAKKGA